MSLLDQRYPRIKGTRKEKAIFLEAAKSFLFFSGKKIKYRRNFFLPNDKTWKLFELDPKTTFFCLQATFLCLWLVGSGPSAEPEITGLILGK